jgi:hypothetical protein
MIKQRKRTADDLENSPGREERTKKHATGFIYDKEKHCYESNEFRTATYEYDNANGIYKVNVQRADSAMINRIGFGRALRRINPQHVKDCKMVSRNTICITFSERESANKFVKDEEKLKGIGYVATIPIYYRSVVGVIKDVPTDMTAKEIFDEIETSSEILRIERMTRRLKNGHRDYSLNVKIHFKGDILPSHIAIYGFRERVQPYIAPVLQCVSCLKFGHHSSSCKSSLSKKKKCSRCGLENHRNDECMAARPTCIHCKQEHDALARECPERMRQNNVRILMTSEKLSFQEVLEKYPQFTSKNQFDLLSNLQDFPTLNRASYKQQLTGRTKFVYANKQYRPLSLSRRPDKFSSMYAENTIRSEPTRPMGANMHKVTEIEKELTAMAAGKSEKELEMMNNTVLSENLNMSDIQEEEENSKNNYNDTTSATTSKNHHG